ncbi:carbon-nitrogen family hydrolase [Burkholderiales bacterium GJ-E10]|nr:carbon-nitrogen family hydrolase [Burkholderiales bacterium GJ-E10]
MTSTSPNRAQVDFPAPRLRVAAIQMTSTPRCEDNLRAAAEQIAEAARQGAQLVALPEYFCLMGLRDTDKLALREADGHGPIQDFLAEQAARHGIWLIGGSIPLAAPEPDRVFNSLPVYDPQGRRVARYDKIHLFSFHRGAESYDEARSIAPGRAPVAFDCAAEGVSLRIACAVCYDLRFPEFFRGLGTVDAIVIPSAFTATTGRAHWELLLRARAVENLCYVLAPAQGGRHENGRTTFGHSMLIDPWGEVLAVRDDGPGVVLGEIDPDRIRDVRASLPALDHRVLV